MFLFVILKSPMNYFEQYESRRKGLSAGSTWKDHIGIVTITKVTPKQVLISCPLIHSEFYIQKDYFFERFTFFE